MINADRKQRFARVVWILTLCVSCACCTSCKRGAEEVDPSDAAASAVNPRPVQLFEVPSDLTTEERTFPVFVKGGETTKLSFRVPGKIVEFDAVVGKRYKKGETIARLDPRDYLLAVQRAERSIEEAKAGLNAMETGARAEDVDSLKAALTAAKTQLETAKRQFDRMESLRKDGAASDVQYDLARTAYEGAKAAELAAEKNLEKANKGSRDEEIEMVKAKIAGLEIDREMAMNKLNDTTIEAPFDGVISEKFFDNYETIAPGVSIGTLIDDSSFEGELSVSEEFIARQGDVETIECSFEAIPDKTFNAEIKQASSSVQKGNRSYLATLKIDAAPEDGLLIGMVGVAKLRLKNADDFVTIPAKALVAGDDKLVKSEVGTVEPESSVWVLNEQTSTVERRSVKVGVFVNDQAQILEGLQGGEKIVSAGARFLTDGQQVRIQ